MTGSIVYATEQGLGYLAKSFYDNGIVDLVLVQKHTSRKNHPEWYPNRVADAEELLDKCDTLLFFETPFYWNIVNEAKRRGIKTVLMPMYECTLNPLPYKPDVIISPSLLDQDYFPDSEFVTVPVTQKWKLRKKAEVFVHNAGNGGLGGRNGTKELIEAMKWVESPIKLIIRSQSMKLKCDDPRVEIQGPVPRETLYDQGDVFIFPEKFNGLSLPLQEAYASGMLVMTTDRHPNNTWLPNDCLIPVDRYKTQQISRRFEVAVVEPEDIAKTIDEWYGKDISDFSRHGKIWGEQHSWEKLKPKYLEICER